ncbi:MAG: hypothetical protein ACI3T9_02940 [Romboutsia timonensis]
MGVFDSELTLPGVITEILPVTIKASTGAEFGTTEAVTVIGTAFNGPVGEPVPIGSPDQAIYYFGDSFDSATKREATLVPEIQDAYDRGCRTIYAVRVGGIEMYKDFDLAVETDLKLRVAGYYPHNGNKKCFMTYSATQGSEDAFGIGEGVVKIYKPADRTTIAEKNSGVVDSMDTILVTEINLDSEGFTKDSRLCDVLDVINNKSTNNVLKFYLVDKDGVRRTNSDREVQQIPVGALFPGIYTICRDEAGPGVDQMVTNVTVVDSNDAKLYPLSDASVWKKLVANTDPSKPYPIGAENFSSLRQLLKNVGTIDSYKFLETVGEIDKLAVANKTDYEEVDIDGFELYRKLGSGFLRTAKLKEVGQDKDGNPKYKVVPAPDGDEHRVVAVEDGIYSTLRMHNTDYTVLAAATCETDITGKLPKKSDFRKTKVLTTSLQTEEGEDFVVVTPKVDVDDYTSDLVNHKIIIEEADRADMDQETLLSRVSKAKFRLLPELSETPDDAKVKGVPEGTLAFCTADAKLYKLTKEVFVEADPALIGNVNIVVGLNADATARRAFMFTDGAYAQFAEGDIDVDATDLVAVMSNDEALIYKVVGVDFQPFCSLKDIADKIFEEEDFTAICAEQDMPMLGQNGGNITFIKIASTELEYASVEEFVDTLNDSSALKNRFLFEVTGEVATEDMVPVTGQGNNRLEGYVYDTSLYIPYTTTDNLARHLAQHCFYTSLQSYPTHGVIGCDKLTGVTLSTISERVDAICSLKLDMYAKKYNGNNVYTSNNVPYSIGRCVSIVFAQYTVSTGNGYGYISSGASGYAGMLSTLDADVSSTNQDINITTDALMLNLSNYQLTRLNTAGIVCFRKVGDAVKVVDGITQDESDSPYRRLSTIKVMNATAKLLRDAIQPFIGKVRTEETMNAMETAIKSVLNKVTGVLINKYSYSISSETDDNYLGIVRIRYGITPAYEIRQVFNELEIS